MGNYQPMRRGFLKMHGGVHMTTIRYMMKRLAAIVFLSLYCGLAGAVDFTSNISPTHSRDTFALSVSSDSEVRLISTLTGSLNGGNSGFYIKAADGTTDVVRSGWAHPGTTEGPWPLKAGTYYLTLWNNDSNTGSYTASVSMTPNALPGDPEPNDSAASAVALPINTAVTGHLGYYNESTDYEDWYKVTTGAAGSFNISLTKDTTLGAYSGIIMYLADATTDVRDTSLPLPAGTYYLRVWANTWGYGGYSLRADFTPSSSKSPALTLSTGTLSFGYQEVGSTSAARTIILTNSGNAPATLTSISIGGDFAASNSCSATLAAGTSCTLNITFSPSATGSRSNTLKVDAGTAGTLSANVNGNGIVTSSAAGWSITELNQSSPDNVTLQLAFSPSPAERNGVYNLYVAGLYTGRYYFLTWQNGQLAIVPYAGGSFPVAATVDGTLLHDSSGGIQTWSFPLGDLRNLQGLEIYAGFGRSDADMLSRGQVQLIYRVN